MTDKEKILEMLVRAEIVYENEPSWGADGENAFTVEAGYACFYSSIVFNRDGSLKAIEAYE